MLIERVRELPQQQQRRGIAGIQVACAYRQVARLRQLPQRLMRSGGRQQRRNMVAIQRQRGLVVHQCRHLLDGVSTRAGLKVVFRSSAPDQLPSDLAVCLYRAVHEAVANVVRHARATTLEVAFEWNDRGIVCKVGDDGVGLPDRHVAKTGLGILGIRERVKGLRGELVLTSAPGQGTHLVISIPVHRGEPCHGDTSPDR
jgi:two-component sensor histidine kinase